MASNPSGRAEQYEAKAKAKLTSWTPFGFGKGQKMEEAADLYNKAATQFKIAKSRK
jgi:Soluble NSF attachment protein, SNAP